MVKFYPSLILFLGTLHPLLGQLEWMRAYPLSELVVNGVAVRNGTIYTAGAFDQGISSVDHRAVVQSIDLQAGDLVYTATCPELSECQFTYTLHSMAAPAGTDAVYVSMPSYFGDRAQLAKVKLQQDRIEPEWILEDFGVHPLQTVEQIEVAADGLLAVGVYGGNIYRIFKIDSLGANQWTQSIEVSEIGYSPLLAVLPDGTSVMTYRDGLNTSTDYVTKYGPDGKQQWSKRTPEWIHAITADRLGEVFTVESRKDGSGQPFLFVHYDEAGIRNVLHERFDLDGFVYAVTDTTGYIYVGGSWRGAFRLFTFSSDGTLVSTADYQQPGYEHQLRSLAMTDDGRLVLAGSGRSTDGQYSSAGIVAVINPSASLKGTTAVKSRRPEPLPVAPTPARGIVYVTVPQTTDPRFELLDSYGRLLRSGELLAGVRTPLDVSDMAYGMYIVRVRGTDGVDYIGRVFVD